MYMSVNIWGLIVILLIYFSTLKKFLYAGTLEEMRLGRVCLSGSSAISNLELENSGVVQEDGEGDYLGLFCFF